MSLKRKNEVVTAGSFELVWSKRVRASDGNIYDVLYFRSGNEYNYLTVPYPGVLPDELLIETGNKARAMQFKDAGIRSGSHGAEIAQCHCCGVEEPSAVVERLIGELQVEAGEGKG